MEWNPEYGGGFDSGSSSRFCPSEGIPEDFPLTYTTLNPRGTSVTPGTSTPLYQPTIYTASTRSDVVSPIYSTFQTRNQGTGRPDYQNQPSLVYSHQLPVESVYNQKLLHPQLSLPDDDSLCLPPPPPNLRYLHQTSLPCGADWSSNNNKEPIALASSPYPLYGSMATPRTDRPERSDSSYTEELSVEDYRESYGEHL